MLIIPDVTRLTEEEFKAERRKAVQATDIAKIMNLNKYGSALSVYNEKKGIDSDFDYSNYTKDGHMLEPVLLKRFEEETGFSTGAAPELHRMADGKPLGCTLDGLCKDPAFPHHGIVEIKAVGQNSWHDWSEDAPPAIYHLQVQQQLLVTQLDFAYLYAWSWGQGTRIYKILPDEAIQQKIIDAAMTFWNVYVKQDLPPLDSTYFCTAEDIKALYPRALPGEERELSEFSMMHIEDYERLSLEIKSLEVRKEIIKKALMVELGTAERGIAPNGRQVNWTQVDGFRLDIDRLKKEKPDIYKSFLKASNSRRFSIKGANDE